MGEDARPEAAGPVRYEVIEHPRHNGRGPVGHLMLEAEAEGHDAEGPPRVGADWDFCEIRVDDKTQQEAAPEELLDDRDHDDRAGQAQGEVQPIGPAGSEVARIKSLEPRRPVE